MASLVCIKLFIRRDLTPPYHSVEDGVQRAMKLTQVLAGHLCLVVTLFMASPATPQNPPSPDTSAPPRQTKPDSQTRITIQVSGGDKDSPVENASVYVKYVEEHVIRKNKKVELNVKTNRDGVAHVPDAPLGRALIQIVAEGWKTYGRWYDITDPKQTIKIRLERPPKWY
jgi:hypothetical protein